MKVDKTKILFFSWLPSTYDKNMVIWNIFPSKSSELVALFCENFFERLKSWFFVKIWQNFAIEKTLEWDVNVILLISVWNGKMPIPFCLMLQCKFCLTL
jgi:hypothetical protein